MTGVQTCALPILAIYTYYVKTNNLEFAQQIELLASNIVDLAVLFGFDKKAQDESLADAAFMKWIIEADNAEEKHYHESKDYLYAVRHSGKGGIVLPIPQPPILSVPPAVVPNGIQYRYTQKINQIKANVNCSDDLLKKIGALSTLAAKDSLLSKPDPKVVVDAGHPVISYHKYGFAAANLYKDSGKGYGDMAYKTMTTTSFKDPADLPAAGLSVLWKYKMMYLLNDVETGVMSDEISISISGK